LGGSGSKQGATKRGDRGQWCDVTPRRGKAQEQVDGQRDRFWEEQRHGGYREQRQGWSRVRVRYGSSSRYDSEDELGFCDPILANDGKVVLQYSRPRFTTDIHKEDGRDRYARRSLSCQRELDDEEWPRVSKCTAGYHYRFGSRGRVQHLKASETRAAGHRHRSVSRGKVQQQHKAVMSAADLPHRSVSRARRQKTHNNVTQQQQNIPGTTSSIVSFYFTNVLEDISYNCLRQGFEVCGIMEDVYLARKRNVNGGVFGFVRYCKVRDVDKLLRALNNVWFGDCKVVAKVASFDRYGNKKGASRAGGEGGKVFEGEKIKEGEKRKDVGESSLEGEKRKDERFGGGVELDVKKGGEIVYGVNKGLEVATTGEGKVVVAVPNHVGGKASGGEVHGKQVFVPKYTSNVKDVAWATKGLVVSVLMEMRYRCCKDGFLMRVLRRLL